MQVDSTHSHKGAEPSLQFHLIEFFFLVVFYLLLLGNSSGSHVYFLSAVDISTYCSNRNYTETIETELVGEDSSGPMSITTIIHS